MNLGLEPTEAGHILQNNDDHESVLCDLLTCYESFDGVPDDELERIFDAFLQSSRPKDGSGGTGLGLAISRRIMQAHGGTITAGLREGGGSVFRIWLPGRDTPAPLVFD